MATLCVGDLHLKQQQVLPHIDALLKRGDYSINRIVFLGDACNDWDARPREELAALNFYADWIEAKRAEGLTVDVLLGNHDFAYIRGVEGPGTILTIMFDVREILEKRLKAKVATLVGGALCTHAGITSSWRRNYALDFEPKNDAQAWCVFLNEMQLQGRFWEALDSCGPGRGYCGIPGPLWADYHELIRAPWGAFDQIVGHTPLKTVTRHRVKPQNIDLYFCDTMSTGIEIKPLGDGSMLLVHDDGSKEVIPFCGESAESFAEVVAEYRHWRFGN